MIIYEDGEQFNVPTKWLADHDNQIRDDVIGEFVERVENENINIYEQPINCVRKVAMQMKGEQNE